MSLLRIARLPYGRVLHLVDASGMSVCGRNSSQWTRRNLNKVWRDGKPSACRLCAKGDRLRMPT